MNINIASLDEIESVLGVSRKIAKEIVKLRAAEGVLTAKSLKGVPGVGGKTLERTTKIVTFDPEKTG